MKNHEIGNAKKLMIVEVRQLLLLSINVLCAVDAKECHVDHQRPFSDCRRTPSPLFTGLIMTELTLTSCIDTHFSSEALSVTANADKLALKETMIPSSMTFWNSYTSSLWKPQENSLIFRAR
jgi:hypothetical protein